MWVKYIVVGLMLCQVYGASLSEHPIHISLAEIHQNKESNKLEMSIKIFIDDLEDDLALHGHRHLNIGTDKEAHHADSIIHQYLIQYFKIHEQQRPIKFNWIGKELSEDLMAIWCYLESDAIDDSAHLTFDYCILMNLYGDQKNILHAYLKGGKNIHKIYTFRQCKRF